MLYIELLGTIIVLSSVGGKRGYVVALAVMSPRGWLCLGDTLVFVCLFLVLMSCVRSCSGRVRPALSRWCSLVVLPAVCECARARAVGRSKPLVGMFIVNNIILYNLQVVYRQAIDTIFRMPIYPMLNRWNANPMTPNPGL